VNLDAGRVTAPFVSTNRMSTHCAENLLALSEDGGARAAFNDGTGVTTAARKIRFLPRWEDQLRSRS